MTCTPVCLLPAHIQLHCARLCGVDRAVLLRAADVQERLADGRPVKRLQVCAVEGRVGTVGSMLPNTL
jgi:hypothetical protein